MNFLSLVFAVQFIVFTSFTQQGEIDITFNNGDVGFGNGDGAIGNGFSSDVYQIHSTSIQSDGKIIIGGDFDSYNGKARNDIARINVDGTLDTFFNPGTGIEVGPGNEVWATAIQSDGKIIIAGQFSSYNGTTRNNIVRINEDGSVDPTFNSVIGASSGIRSVSIQPDGKIIIGGYFTSYNGTNRNHIARINTDGSLDLSFNPGTGTDHWIMTTTLQGDGKIIIAGAFQSFNGNLRRRIARINADGSFDSSFSPGTGASSNIYTCIVQSDGKIIIGGDFHYFNDNNIKYIARLNSDGSLDFSFNPGTALNNNIITSTIQSDGKILIGGNFTSYNGTSRSKIARLNSNGSLDFSFDPGEALDNSGLDNSTNAIAIQSDGKIIIGGLFSIYNGTTRERIARINSDGSHDISFNTGSGANNVIYTSSIQSDGKIIIGGLFTVYNGTPINHIARLNVDGTLDTDFNVGTGVSNAFASINSSCIQSDGKIIIGGEFTDYNGTAIKNIVRLNIDGTLDATFNPGTGPNNGINTISLQSDGKILIGGGFTSYNGTLKNRLARLNTNGTLDPTFINGGVSNYINTSIIQPDGKIILGGEFIMGGSGHIIRYESNGYFDSTFDSGLGANQSITAINIQSDGKIIIGGYFTSFDGYATNRICRLNNDGSFDTTFVTGTGADGAIQTISVESNGKIIIGGKFTLYNGINRNGIARLNSDGSLDLTFNSSAEPIVGPSVGHFSAVQTTSIQDDGKIIIGGNFTSYNGTGRNRISRINNNTINTSPLGITTFCSGESLFVSYTVNGIYNIGNVFTLQLSDSVGNFNSPIEIGELLSTSDGTIAATLPLELPSGLGYKVRVISSDPVTLGTVSTEDINVFSTLSTTIINSCNDYTWTDGNIYNSSGQYTQNLINQQGCDSVAILDLIILPLTPINITNVFTMHSDANICSGALAIDISGNLPAQLEIDANGVSYNSLGYNLITDLCDGLHSLQLIDLCGDTTNTQFVIAVDSNYIFNNNFIDSLAQDSLGLTLTNCEISYNGISNAYIDSIWATGNVVNLIWNIVDVNGSNYDTISYELNNGNGVYWLQLSVFCPNKSVGEYFTVTESIYYFNGTIGTLGIKEENLDLVEIYPNPTFDFVSVCIPPVKASLNIYDTQGKLISVQEINSDSKISLINFQPGVYFFEIEMDKSKFFKRVFKY